MKGITGDPGDRDRGRTWVEVNLNAVRRNAQAAQACLSGGESGIVAVVKADGYGLGMLRVARAVSDLVRAFAVANAEEALVLRGGGITNLIYVLGPALPEERAILARGEWFCPSVSDLEEMRAFEKEAELAGRKLPVHVVVDTGMGRMGALPESAAALVRAVAESRWLELDSVASHFPSADSDREFTTGQEAWFRQWADTLRAEGVRLEKTQIANSAGLTAYARRNGELARAGLMLYGISPVPECQHLLCPVVTWSTRVTQVRTLPAGWGVSYGRTYVTGRPTVVATLGVGYADGYPRQVSGKGAQVLIQGQRCPVLGRVTMDQLMVDVSHLTKPVHPGDAAVLVGSQGPGEITAGELAEWGGTIPWDILTGLGARVRRIHVMAEARDGQG